MSSNQGDGYLYSNGSPESKEAESILHNSGVPIQIIRISDEDAKENGFNPPELQTIEGGFNGLDEIRSYVSLVTHKSNGNGLSEE